MISPPTRHDERDEIHIISVNLGYLSRFITIPAQLATTALSRSWVSKNTLLHHLYDAGNSKIVKPMVTDHPIKLYLTVGLTHSPTHHLA